jgi:hypothetical protein
VLSRPMKTKQVATITLIILLGLIAYGMFRTGRSMKPLQVTPGGKSSQAEHRSAIDQSALDNARRLAQMPTSADELPMAQEALRLSDREMDLAFAAGVREVQEHPPVLSAEAKQSEVKLQNAQKSLEADNARVEQLTSALSKATGAKASGLEEQLEQAKVQVQLDQDEVDYAKQELALAGGDTQGRIEQLMKEHDAASHVADTTTVNTSTPAYRSGLVHRYQQWSDLHDKKFQLWQAKQDADSAAVAFTKTRDALQSNIKTKTQPGLAPAGERTQPGKEGFTGSPHEALRASTASGSLLDSWVWFERFSP